MIRRDAWVGEIVLKREGTSTTHNCNGRRGKVVNVEARALIGWSETGRCDPCSFSEKGKRTRYGERELERGRKETGCVGPGEHA